MFHVTATVKSNSVQTNTMSQAAKCCITEGKYIIPWHIWSSRSIFHFAKAGMRFNSCSMSKQLWPKEGTITGDMTIWNSFMLQTQISPLKLSNLYNKHQFIKKLTTEHEKIFFGTEPRQFFSTSVGLYQESVWTYMHHVISIQDKLCDS